VPAGDGWLHEVKFDGYRVQVHKVGSRVIIYSRNGHDFTERFPSIAQLLHEFPAKAAVLDGEVVASNADDSPNFARLHVRWAGLALSTCGHSTCLRSMAVISVCNPWLSARQFCRPCWSALAAPLSRYPSHSQTA
jgi:hypothetical protein